METLNDSQKYIASEILSLILREDSDKYMVGELFGNAIRLCLGKQPYKTSAEYYKEAALFDFLEDKNAANDVY